MPDDSREYFQLLKHEIAATLQQSFPAVPDDPGKWKGQTIQLFQVDLMEKVNDQVSEKWFYNHLKTGKRSLPRIDMLNLLSRYTGYANWEEFCFSNKERVRKSGDDRSNRVFITVPLILIGVVAVFLMAYKVFSIKEYTFCFVSEDGTDIVPDHLQCTFLGQDESPTMLHGDENGCVTVKTSDIRVNFLVSATYFKPDTITRVLKKVSRHETIALTPDDYALMLHYFSTANTRDWERRRTQLDLMIADSAKIFEVMGDGIIGLELYNKWEFIDKLSVPVQSLRHIRILDTEYSNERIVRMRFTQSTM